MPDLPMFASSPRYDLTAWITAWVMGFGSSQTRFGSTPEKVHREFP